MADVLYLLQCLVTIGAVIAVALTSVPALLLDAEPPIWLSFEGLAALLGSALGWLFVKLA